MPVKIRLTRRGKKGKPYYHIVIADSRAPRDGKYIEKLGAYNPTTNPATIELDFDRALEWLQKGAQPTDTCRAILSYKGVLLKKHLLDGVKKNAFTLEETDEKHNAWLKEKEAKIQAKKEKITKEKEKEIKKRFEAESKVKEARAVELAKKYSELAEETEKKDSTPPERKDSTPPEKKDSTPPERKDSTPPEKKDSTSPERKDSTSPERKDSTSPERKDSTSPEKKDSTPKKES